MSVNGNNGDMMLCTGCGCLLLLTSMTLFVEAWNLRNAES